MRKHIKKFNEPSEEEILSSYKEVCDDIDDKSYITFDQFFDNLDFDAFDPGYSITNSLNYSNISYAASGSYNGFRGDFDINIKGSNVRFHTGYYDGTSCPVGLKSSIEWKKRNIYFYVEVDAGGASGGSCYDTGDDDGARPYDGDSLDLHEYIFVYLKMVFDKILSNYANNISSTELCNILYKDPSSIIKEDSRCDSEYYGNYTNYNCYYITIGDLFEFLSKNDAL